MLQLLDPQILQQFVLTAEGAGDITDMLTSETMLADYQMILQQFAQMPEGVSEILAQMEAGIRRWCRFNRGFYRN